MSEKKKTEKTKNLNAGHRKRMRHKYIKGGIEVFAEHEIIELLLFSTVPRKNTNKMAHQILNEFGSLHALFDATPQEILRRTEVSEQTAVLFSMIPQIFKRYSYSKNDKKLNFKNSKTMGEFIKLAFIGKVYECFYIMCLDNSLNVLSHEIIQEGTLDIVQLNLRDIAEVAITNKSSYVVLAHNHPSGSQTVSREDILATSDIKYVLEKFNIEVLDHFVIANDNYISFAENNFCGLRGIDQLK